MTGHGRECTTIGLEVEPLLWSGSTKEVLENGLDPAADSLYFGTGLATPTIPSVGIPFDILAMVLVAEKLRRALGMRRICHHIADTHAVCNGIASSDSIASLANQYEAVMSRVIRVTGFPIRVFRSSDFDTSPEYQRILRSIEACSNEYVRRELADMAWYVRNERVGLKLGWILESLKEPGARDERMFDHEFRRAFPAEKLVFAYTVSGKTLDPTRPRAAPYIATSVDRRILLSKGEAVRTKMNDAIEASGSPLRHTVAHLGMIVRLWNDLTPAHAGRGPLHVRLQRIIDAVFA